MLVSVVWLRNQSVHIFVRMDLVFIAEKRKHQLCFLDINCADAQKFDLTSNNFQVSAPDFTGHVLYRLHIPFSDFPIFDNNKNLYKYGAEYTENEKNYK